MDICLENSISWNLIGSVLDCPLKSLQLSFLLLDLSVAATLHQFCFVYEALV